MLRPRGGRSETLFLLDRHLAIMERTDCEGEQNEQHGICDVQEVRNALKLALGLNWTRTKTLLIVLRVFCRILQPIGHDMCSNLSPHKSRTPIRNLRPVLSAC